ncbi:MAG: methylisocitrate lyase [Geminicoccaceae bacterium]|nr:methylisocitrate lyase [Geminicoccaceae bacterium]
MPGLRLAERWQKPGILRLPGAHDALSGLLAKEAGFEALYVSGAALTASRGLPDLGILTQEELCGAVRSIARATGLPLVVDGDTGYGEALNAMRLVRELEEAGAGAVHIEDQVLPKKCGHLSDKRLVPARDMAAKVAAARRARRHLRIIARTDAAASEGIDAAIDRARLYLAAGADAVFPEALASHDDLRRFRDAIEAPLLANMTEFGRTPPTTAAAFEALGYAMVIWPVSALRVAAGAMRRFYADLESKGSVEGHIDAMLTRRDLYGLIGYHDYEALDASLLKSALPAGE